MCAFVSGVACKQEWIWKGEVSVWKEWDSFIIERDMLRFMRTRIEQIIMNLKTGGASQKHD